MTRPGLRRPIPHGLVALALCTVAIMSGLALVPPADVVADTSGGQSSSYTVPSRDVNNCSLFTPLFTNNVDGRTSTFALSHESTSTTTVTARVRRLGGGTLITRNFSLAARQLMMLGPSDLGVPTGFSGSVEISVEVPAPTATPTATATASPSPTRTPTPTNTPVTGSVFFDGSEMAFNSLQATPVGAGTSTSCGLYGVVLHDADNGDRMTVEAFRQNEPRSDLFVPAVHKNDSGMNTDVIIQNTDRDRAQTAVLTFRPDTGPQSPDRAITIPADSAMSVDMTNTPDGVSTLEIDGPTEARLLATAYHRGTGGLAAAMNAFSTGSDRMSLALLFRKAGSENGYSSLVRVMKVRPGAVTPRITLWDRDTGALIGPITARRADGSEVVLRENQGFTWDLTQLRELADGKIYSAEVDSTEHDELIAVAGHLNMGRGTLSGYSGVRESSTDRVLSVPLVVKNEDGVNAGIQLRNLGGNDAAVVVRFFNPRGNRMPATESLTVPSRDSQTVYLPTISDLPDGTYTAEITSSAPISAVVNLVRYR